MRSSHKGSLRAVNIRYEKRKKRKLLEESHNEAPTPSIPQSFCCFVPCETPLRRRDEIKTQIGVDALIDELIINLEYPCTNYTQT